MKAKKKIIHNLNTIEWNCRTLNKERVTSLGQVLDEEDIHIVLLQSVKLPKNQMPDFPNHRLVNVGYRYSATQTKKKKLKKKESNISTAIYVHKNLNSHKLKSDIKRSRDSSNCSCEVIIDNTSYKFTSIYYPTGVTTEVDLDYLDNKDPLSNHLIGGDFNNHTSLWSNLPNALESTVLSRKILNSKYVVLNTGEITHKAERADCLPSAIDITLVTPSLANSTWYPLPQFAFGSDHVPCLITTPIKSTDNSLGFTPTYKCDNADWPAFQTHLTGLKFEDLDTDNIDELEQKLTKKVIEAADKTIPKTKPPPDKPYNPWWDAKCSKAKTEFQDIQKYCYWINNDDSRKLETRARLDYNEVIAKAKLDYWNDILKNEVKDYRDSGVLWRKLKQFKRGNHHSRSVIKHNGKLYVSDKEKAHILADKIASKSQKKSLTKEELKFREQFEKNYTDPKPDNNKEFNKPITKEELDLAIKGIVHKNRAAGLDKVNYQMLCNMPDNMKEIYLRFFNKCFKLGKMPQNWKEASVMPLLKPGKSACDVDSYRPISLTPHTSKIYERIIKNRLEYEVEKREFLPDFQSGFRTARSTTDNLVYLTELMKKTLINKNKQRHCIFFDVHKAFDRVWHVKLLSKLKELGFSGNMYEVIKDFLNNRKMSVKIGNERSDFQTVEMGTPQGAVLSPLLFAIMLYDIKKLQLDVSELLLYADDIALISKIAITQNEVAVRRSYQSDINKLTEYMKNNGFQLSSTKTQLLFVSKKANAYKFVHFKVNGQTVEASKEIKYLGITFHYQLSWSPHFKTIRAKVNKHINLIKSLRNQPWAIGSKFLVDVARALVRSVMSYGQECFFSAPKSQLGELSRLERQAIKTALGLPMCADNNDRLYREVGWLTLEEERKLRCAQYIVRVRKIPKHFNQTVLNDTFATVVEVTKSSKKKKQQDYIDWQDSVIHLWAFSKPILSKTIITLESLEDICLPLIPPGQIKPPTYHYTIPKGMKKTDNEALAGSAATCYIQEHFAHHFQIYTDGSILESREGGIGIAWKNPGSEIWHKNLALKAGDFLSIYSTELHAIWLALNIAKNKGHQKIALMTDSLSSIQALQSKPKLRFNLHRNIVYLITELINNGVQVDICHVPSHCGVKGNKYADKLAKEGVNTEMDPLITTYTQKEYRADLWEECTKDPDNFPLLADRIKNKHKITIFPNLHPHIKIFIRKIMFSGLATRWMDYKCDCGDSFNISHIFSNSCHSIQHYFGDLIKFYSDNGVKESNFFLLHDKLGWQPACLFFDKVYSSPFAICF